MGDYISVYIPEIKILLNNGELIFSYNQNWLNIHLAEIIWFLAEKETILEPNRK